jgi:hypothetical protein
LKPVVKKARKKVLGKSTGQRLLSLNMLGPLPLEDSMKKTVLPVCVVLLALVALGGILLGQIAEPPAFVNVIRLIPVPGWTTAAGAFDLGSFNPVNRLIYFGDGTNHAVTTVDTTTNTLVSALPIGCTTSSCPSGVQVASDLQKLLVSSRQNRLWIYDLRTPGAPPVVIDGPQSGYDEMDYDSIHQRFYVANTNAPYFLSAIDLVGPNANTITAQVPLPDAPEQPRFNPNDGLIYLTIPTVASNPGGVGEIAVVDPTAGPTGEGGLVTTITGGGSGSIPSVGLCGPQGNDIDPVTNLMLLGCRGAGKFNGGLNGAAVFNLTTGQMLSFQPVPNGNLDVLKYNPNNRRWYIAAGGDANNGGTCPSTNAGNVWPTLGVFAAPAAGSGATSGSVTFVGTSCSGRGATRALVDTIGNNIYVNAVQYPADPTSANTGQAGILAFNDPAPTVPVLPASQATLGTYGTATFSQDGLQMRAFASLTGLSSTTTLLVVASSVGNETVPCTQSAGNATCSGTLIGTPVVGSPVDLANNGKIVAQGKVVQTSPLVVTGFSLSTSTAVTGSTYMATVSGSNLTQQTSIDIDVSPPGSSASIVANNWQVGAAASHTVAPGSTGTWTINGVRAHQDPNNHTGSFVPVSATLTVMR